MGYTFYNQSEDWVQLTLFFNTDKIGGADFLQHIHTTMYRFVKVRCERDAQSMGSQEIPQ